MKIDSQFKREVDTDVTSCRIYLVDETEVVWRVIYDFLNKHNEIQQKPNIFRGSQFPQYYRSLWAEIWSCVENHAHSLLLTMCYEGENGNKLYTAHGSAHLGLVLAIVVAIHFNHLFHQLNEKLICHLTRRV